MELYKGTTDDCNLLRERLRYDDIHTIYDNRQNFCIDMLDNFKVNQVKETLKEMGANKFRSVKRGSYKTAICFYISKDSINKLVLK